jgi:hypothetical protein
MNAFVTRTPIDSALQTRTTLPLEPLPDSLRTRRSRFRRWRAALGMRGDARTSPK